MPWCPICKTEYREGFTQCTDCRTPLVAEKPEGAPCAPALMDGVAVYVAATTTDAEMICEMLRNADIYAAPRGSAMGDLAKAYTGTSLYGTQILVDRAQVAAAQELLQTWAAQDARAPISEEELSRAALSLPQEDGEPGGENDDELARQAQAAPPAALRDNGAFRALRAAALALLVLAVLLYLVAR